MDFSFNLNYKLPKLFLGMSITLREKRKKRLNLPTSNENILKSRESTASVPSLSHPALHLPNLTQGHMEKPRN